MLPVGNYTLSNKLHVKNSSKLQESYISTINLVYAHRMNPSGEIWELFNSGSCPIGYNKTYINTYNFTSIHKQMSGAKLWSPEGLK